MGFCPIDTRVRAVFFHEGKILLMRLKNGTYFSLPGGGWEAPESSKECLKREMKEELGIDVTIGNLACVNEYMFREQPCNELWYFMENSGDFTDITKLGGTHAYEFDEIGWFDLEQEDISVMPIFLIEAHRYWKSHGPVFFQL